MARAAGADVVVLDGNPGFGAANNAGLAHARHDVTVLLNPDCVLLDAGLARLAALAAERDALVVPRLLNADGTLQRSAHPLPGTPAALLRAVLPTRALPEPHRSAAPHRARLGDRGLRRRAHGAAAAPGPVRPERVPVLRGPRPMPAGARRRRADRPAPGARPAPHRRSQRGPRLALKARRRREVVGAALGRRALAIDDAAQALTFLARAAVGRRRAENVEELRALRAARSD